MRWLIIIVVVIVGFLIGAYFLAPPLSLEETSAANAPTADTGLPDWAGHVISLAFGALAVVLIFKKSDNNAILLFSLAVLAALFGRYVGPLALPDFLGPSA